jgi:hypothetical protein
MHPALRQSFVYLHCNLQALLPKRLNRELVRRSIQQENLHRIVLYKLSRPKPLKGFTHDLSSGIYIFEHNSYCHITATRTALAKCALGLVNLCTLYMTCYSVNTLFCGFIQLLGISAIFLSHSEPNYSNILWSLIWTANRSTVNFVAWPISEQKKMTTPVHLALYSTSIEMATNGSTTLWHPLIVKIAIYGSTLVGQLVQNLIRLLR